ncbi:MAG: DinB family protein [Dokdonella sp.]
MSQLSMLTRYKIWADELTYSAVRSLPEGEATKARPTRFGNMVHTLNHVHVIDSIFQAHLQGRAHGFTARNTPTHPPLHELWQSVRVVDQWYVDYAAALSEAQSHERVEFRFVDGGVGVMTRAEMILHVVNHGTYHRGFVGDMMYQVPVMPPATDLPVFLRDVAS